MKKSFIFGAATLALVAVGAGTYMYSTSIKGSLLDSEGEHSMPEVDEGVPQNDTVILAESQLQQLDAGETVVVEDAAQDADASTGNEAASDEMAMAPGEDTANTTGTEDGNASLEEPMEGTGGGDSGSPSSRAATCANTVNTLNPMNYSSTAYNVNSRSSAEAAAKAAAIAKFNAGATKFCQNWAQTYAPQCESISGPPAITCVSKRVTGTPYVKNSNPNPEIIESVVVLQNGRRTWKAVAKYYATCEGVRECVDKNSLKK